MNFFTHNTAASQVHQFNSLIDPLCYTVFFGAIAYVLFLVVCFAAKKRQAATTDLCFCDKQISIDECIESNCPTFAAVAEAFENSAIYGIAEVPATIADPWETTETELLPSLEGLLTLNIRKLKSLAVGRLTNYSRMTKRELAEALVGKVSPAEFV